MENAILLESFQMIDPLCRLCRLIQYHYKALLEGLPIEDQDLCRTSVKYRYRAPNQLETTSSEDVLRLYFLLKAPNLEQEPHFEMRLAVYDCGYCAW